MLLLLSLMIGDTSLIFLLLLFSAARMMEGSIVVKSVTEMDVDVCLGADVGMGELMVFGEKKLSSLLSADEIEVHKRMIATKSGDVTEKMILFAGIFSFCFVFLLFF